MGAEVVEEPSSTPTLRNSSPPSDKTSAKLDLSKLPPIFLSATHFDTEDLHELEEELVEAGAELTYDVTEAKIVLSKVTRKPRILFDLRAKGLSTEEVTVRKDSSTEGDERSKTEPPSKKAKVEYDREPGKEDSQAIVIDDSSTEDEEKAETKAKAKDEKAISSQSSVKPSKQFVSKRQTSSESYIEQTIRVLRSEWFTESRKAGTPLPFDRYLIYQGRKVQGPAPAQAPKSGTASAAKSVVTAKSYAGKARDKLPTPSSSILERAKEDAPRQSAHADPFGKRKFGHNVPSKSTASWQGGQGKSQYAHLLHTTTSEYDSGASSELPEMPEWVKAGIKYACQRLTPKDNPNDPFIALLKKIKLARLLTNDEIGVRAYSTSIASLAAYTYKISSPREIMALPGCDAKIANLYVEWANTGKITAVEELEANEDLKVLRLFYEIWGVGAATAREFYYDRGWRDLDDIVEYGWGTLSRVQQIGVKYYDEFLDPIPRAEVAEIGRIIHAHAAKVRDKDVQSLIVGGYRRGKEACGDVDIIVSHPDEGKTLNIVNDIVQSLEDEGWITHTLLLSLTSTQRDQQPLPFRAGGGGHGFDTLDKALVVWQDPSWPTKDADLASDPKAKNPNIHRRVDIIISPWRTVGCAVAGWSGGTTFQRDLRRYAKNVKGWKFDSSGVRDRGNGEVVDLEGFYEYHGWIGDKKGRASSLEEAEKRVFERMGLVYREPWERCTG